MSRRFNNLKWIIFFLFLSTQLSAQWSPFRRVLLFASNPKDTFLIQQQKILNGDKTGCDERDIKIEVYLYDKTEKSFLTKFDVQPPQYYFILIGKDGKIRLKSSKVISKETLFGLIDSMPMRKDEMKKKRNKS